MKLFYIVCAAVIAFAACEDKAAVAPAAEVPVKIGFLVSGDRITYPNGAKIAVDEVNERGGLLGRSVELVTQIDIQEAEVAVQAAEAMIRTDEVVAIIGPNRSSHAVEVGAVAQRHGVPMITTAATNPAVTAAGDFVFMAAFTDQFQGRVVAQFAKETLGVNAAAVLTQRGEVYTEGIAEFFTAHFSGLGGAIVAEEFYAGGATDFAAQLTRIAVAAPEALFLAGLPTEVALVTQQARALPLQNAAGEPTLFLGADSWDNPTLLDNEAAAVDGSFFSSHFSPDTDEPSARAFIDTYQARYGIVPTGGDAVSYDAVRLFLEAAERAGRLDPDAVRRQLVATEQYAGATRIARYDENRHPTKSAVVMTIENGAKRFYQQVDPKDSDAEAL